MSRRNVMWSSLVAGQRVQRLQRPVLQEESQADTCHVRNPLLHTNLLHRRKVSNATQKYA